MGWAQGGPELSFSRDTSGPHVCGQGPGPLWASVPSFSRQEAGRGEGMESVAPRNRVATSRSFSSSSRRSAGKHLPPPQGWRWGSLAGCNRRRGANDQAQGLLTPSQGTRSLGPKWLVVSPRAPPCGRPAGGTWSGQTCWRTVPGFHSTPLWPGGCTGELCPEGPRAIQESWVGKPLVNGEGRAPAGGAWPS